MDHFPVDFAGTNASSQECHSDLPPGGGVGWGQKPHLLFPRVCVNRKLTSGTGGRQQSQVICVECRCLTSNKTAGAKCLYLIKTKIQIFKLPCYLSERQRDREISYLLVHSLNCL